MKPTFVLTILTMMLAAAALCHAQNTKPEPCPDVTLMPAPNLLQPGEEGLFSAVLDTKGLPLPSNYEWSALGGEIIAGQGETEVTVRRGEGEVLTVMLKVEGFRPRCENRFSVSQFPQDWKTEPQLIAEFVGDLSESDERIREAFAEEFKKRPQARLTLILKGPRENPEKWYSEQIDFLLSPWIFHYHQFVTIVQAYGDPPRSELWVVERGDKFPPVDE